ncbi:lytic transglycosylase domain-containing protein [Salmonella enterica]|nr:lytic transglycosylase domain-containing protein [Salmonella enterica]
MLSTTAFLAVAMQCAATVHPDTALDVAKTESGFNPFAIAEIIPKKERRPGDKGVISYFPTNKGDALNIVRQIEAKHRRYSVGLMQITSTNFSKFNVNAESLFSPCTNLSVFEKIIVDCYQRGGSLKRALSCYYSGNFTTGLKPEQDYRQTSYVQRIGYTPPDGGWKVPGTKEDRQNRTPATIRPSPPVYETWDVLREYPREGIPENLPETNEVDKEKPHEDAEKSV